MTRTLHRPSFGTLAIYSGILQQSLDNLDELLTVVSAFRTQMTDGERLQKISKVAAGMQTNLDHLRQFNQQNAALSLLRARDNRERQAVRSFYGIK